MKHLIGFTSVTFRDKNIEELIELARECELDGIEWGTDVHITKEEDAEKVARLQFPVFSLGSYYKLCQGLDPNLDFIPLLKLANIMKAPLIRVWATRTASKDADDKLYDSCIKEAQTLCDLAKEYDIEIAFEYHRKSLTDTSKSAIRLIEGIQRENIFLYWQPNPELSEIENMQELNEVRQFVKRIHVFHWKKDNTRLSLKEGESSWQKYIHCLDKEIPLIVEFVKDDSIQQFKEDCLALKEMKKSI